MKFRDRIVDGFFRNPFAWFWLVAFLIAEYGNYQRGMELDRVCETRDPVVVLDHPQTPQDIADKICANRRAD